MFTDQKGKTFTATGAVVVSTAQKRFGLASVYFPGSAHLVSPDSADWDLGSGNFTIELWIRPSAIPVGVSYAGLVSNRGSSSSNFGWALLINGTNGGKVQFIYSSNGVAQAGDVTSVETPSVNAWTHVAVVRDGENLKIYMNGVLSATSSIGTNAIFASTSALGLGLLSLTISGNYFSGYMDEFRLTKNIARYTAAAFPLQEAPYPDS